VGGGAGLHRTSEQAGHAAAALTGGGGGAGALLLLAVQLLLLLLEPRLQVPRRAGRLLQLLLQLLRPAAQPLLLCGGGLLLLPQLLHLLPSRLQVLPGGQGRSGCSVHRRLRKAGHRAGGRHAAAAIVSACGAAARRQRQPQRQRQGRCFPKRKREGIQGLIPSCVARPRMQLRRTCCSPLCCCTCSIWAVSSSTFFSQNEACSLMLEASSCAWAGA
jgi:hypothetical protein